MDTELQETHAHTYCKVLVCFVHMNCHEVVDVDGMDMTSFSTLDVVEINIKALDVVERTS